MSWRYYVGREEVSIAHNYMYMAWLSARPRLQRKMKWRDERAPAARREVYTALENEAYKKRARMPAAARLAAHESIK